MDSHRLGAALRAARVKRGWRQADLAQRVGVGRTLVSQIELGRLDGVSMNAIRRVAGGLDATIQVSIRLPHGELDRLLNAGHAALHESLARYLDGLPGWIHAPEVSFAVYGERGVIDILAFHPATGSLLIIELKAELVSLEDILSTSDIRMRHAKRIARERGWAARSVSAWLVFADSEMNRRRVSLHRAAIRSAFPADGRQIRSWLRQPSGSIRAVSFWSKDAVSGASAQAAMRRRVRKRGQAAKRPLTVADNGVMRS